MATSTTVRPVREIVRMVEDGLFRIPDFQRPFVWSPEQISSFLESVIAGLPTGPILAIRRPAAAETVRLGPVLIAAPAIPDALWIVDGGQRLTALASVLLDRRKFAYDLRSGRVVEFEELSSTLLPFAVLADDDFRQWQSGHSAFAGEAESIRARFLDSPVLLTELPDDGSATETFTRVNTGGSRLRPEDIERARADDEPHDLPSLLDRLNSLRFGRFSEELAGESATAVGESVPQTWRALRAAVAWLRDEAAVPHLDVWRHRELLPTLARYFALNRHPSARARILLRRWLWRSMANPPAPGPPLDAIAGHDSVDASRLVAAVPASPPPPLAYLTAAGEELALTTLGPLSLVTGTPLPVAELLAAWGHEAFSSALGEPLLFPPSGGSLNGVLQAAADRAAVLASHALDRESLDLFFAGDQPKFHERRRRLLGEAFHLSSGRLAAWGASDRPAISALLVSDEEDRDD